MIAPGMTILWNPSFDIWADTGKLPTAWDRITGSGTVGTDYERSDTSKAGRYSFKILNTSATVQVGSAMFPACPLNPYRATFWLRQDTSTSTVTVSAYWFQADRTASSTANTTIYNGTAGSTGSWVQKSAVLTVPSDAYYCSIVINQSGTPGGTTNLDEFSFTEEPVSFRAQAPATTAGGSGTAFSKDGVRDVFFTTEAHDYGGGFDTSTGRFTAPEAGVYEFFYTLQVQCTGGEASMIVGYLQKNGSNLCLAFGGTQSTANYFASVNVSSGPVELAKGDYITNQVFVGARDGDFVNASADSYFSGRKIS